jgi:hypothetical protein
MFADLFNSVRLKICFLKGIMIAGYKKCTYYVEVKYDP